MPIAKKVKVALLHQGIWDMEKLSMPLACGYMKAYAMADERLRDAVDIRIFNYGGGAQLTEIAPQVLLDYRPDILGASVFGWNHNLFGLLTETFRQVNPEGWAIFGGTHVAHQAPKEFRLFPGLDIVVNGEGEITFANILRAYLAGTAKVDLSGVPGISYRGRDDAIHTNAPEPRITTLDDIPSPFLTGAIPLVGDDGEFLYDAVTMETNRGCPYSCSFCYWGGAIGQKIYAFSNERLREELELFGRHKVENVCLCDANFGMLRADAEFLDDFLEVRSKYKYPRSLVTSWAKNKGKLFFDLVRKMKESGLQTDFTVALQSLDPKVLELAKRKNMRVNHFEDLCQWIIEEGFEAYGELIWGLPGETYESFLAGYDRLARYVPRIATYTNLLIPNTEYDINRDKYEFTTLRGQEYDYEYLLSHSAMTYSDNVRMHYFLFLSRVLAEHMVFRFIWGPLRILAGLSQSQILLDFDAWLQRQDDPVSIGLTECQRDVVENLDVTRVYRGLRYLYVEPGVDEMFERWWSESVLPKVPEEHRAFGLELLRSERLSRPLHDERARELGLEVTTFDGQEYYVRRDLAFKFDITNVVTRIRKGQDNAVDATPRPHVITWYYLKGFSRHIDNHEIVLQYTGRTMETLQEEARLRETTLVREKQRHAVGLPVQR
jgi:radical SAM superfamily enzyme YgiQ (UPF0313 family)